MEFLVVAVIVVVAVAVITVAAQSGAAVRDKRAAKAAVAEALRLAQLAAAEEQAKRLREAYAASLLTRAERAATDYSFGSNTRVAWDTESLLRPRSSIGSNSRRD